MDNTREINKDILDELLRSLQRIKYGEVVITIHNSQVVQIERREKRRFSGKENATVPTGHD